MEDSKNMKEKKVIPIIIAGVLICVSMFSGCVGPWVVDTWGWDHMNQEGTSVRIWGQLSIFENTQNWNLGFYWDTQPHDKLEDYLYFSLADNFAALGTFSLTIPNLNRTTTYHYRAYGEYLKAQKEIRWGVDNTFIPGGPRTTTENASDIGLTSVTLKGTLWHLGGAPSCTVYFLYGTDPNALNMQTTPETMTAIGSFDATLTDLITNATYYYKAIAENDADTCSGLVFSVIPGQPIVWTRKQGVVGNTYALLKGELKNTGGTSECTVWFAYSDNSPTNLDTTTPPQTLTTGEFEANIEGLTPNTKYWYQAVASNGVAQGKGEVYEFTTSPSATIVKTGDIGKPIKKSTDTINKDLLSKLPVRLQQLCEKHPMLLKLLQHPRLQALLKHLP
jgi:hypothetical protein